MADSPSGDPAKQEDAEIRGRIAFYSMNHDAIVTVAAAILSNPSMMQRLNDPADPKRAAFISDVVDRAGQVVAEIVNRGQYPAF